MDNNTYALEWEINQTDEFDFGGIHYSFSLHGENTINRDLVLLYVYQLDEYPEHGYKVGMTKCKSGENFWKALARRIAGQEHELALNEEDLERYGKNRRVLFWGVCINDRFDDFKDHAIHRELERQFPDKVEKEQEWFRNIPLESIKDVFNNYRISDTNAYEIFDPRDGQKKAIEKMADYFSKDPQELRFLLNCKMRFGKCYTLYHYAETTKQDKILILTFVPAVEEEWRNNLKHIEKRYDYFTDDDLANDNFTLEGRTDPFVVFLSLQNYLGKDFKTRKIKDKIDKLSQVRFDILVLDEYHFGAWNDHVKETIEDVNKNYHNLVEKEGSRSKIIDKFKITVKQTICLSGTPYKALDREEFREENTFSYSYFDEQREKYPNYDEGEKTPNPKYAEFPDMRIFGFNMSQIFPDLTGEDYFKKVNDRSFFSLNNFFKVSKNPDTNECKFIYEAQIKYWLGLLRGNQFEEGYKFPYQPDNIENVKDSLWLMPSVDACAAMFDLLNNDDFFGTRFKIINISDPSVGSGATAYNYLTEEMAGGARDGKLGSITLTVNKLTLGVTVKEWRAALVLKDLASPEQYFQSIFRIQTPFVEDDIIRKKICDVYDFNIDRAAMLLLKYADESSSFQTTPRQQIDLIVKYLPIYQRGIVDKPISSDVFYNLARFGDASNARTLSEKIRNTNLTTHADEETISAMLSDPACSEALKNAFAYTKFDKKIKAGTLAEPNPDLASDEYKKGERIGYDEGLKNYKLFVYLDYDSCQDELNSSMETLFEQTCPLQYDEHQKTCYHNGIFHGYEKGVNVPVAKMKCGEKDGEMFVSRVTEAFGDDIKFEGDNKRLIRNFVREYLQDIENIPTEYRGVIYQNHYRESFENAVIKKLKPEIVGNNNDLTPGTVMQKLSHLLAKLFQFLYISVYRETTFREIFDNADEDVFLSAVGITKRDFELINQYNVFQESVLDEYVTDFFVNETLGKGLSDEEVETNYYRNSFNWFGHGIDK